jgi:internalin A
LDAIRAALAKTKVAVLLVTPDFLASDFIHENELTPLLKEAESGGVKILWIPVRASAYKESPLRYYQAAVNDLEKPLAEMKSDRDKAWVHICELIKQTANPR